MIEALVFKNAWRGFKPKDMFLFLPGVNLLVGDQGCGKSTILACIVEHGGIKDSFWKRPQTGIKENSILLTSARKKVFAHDFEHDSPQTAPAMDLMGMLPQSMMGHLWTSHGESTRDIVKLIKSFKDAYIILDEPDAGMSPRSAHFLVETLKEAVSNGCQVIASVHNPWVIEAFPQVLSVEHRNWMKSAEFLETQRHPSERPETKIPEIQTINVNGPSRESKTKSDKKA